MHRLRLLEMRLKPSGTMFDDKEAARRHVWTRLQAEGIAAPPFPVHGRIPNFTGAAEAARRLFAMPQWRDARRI